MKLGMTRMPELGYFTDSCIVAALAKGGSWRTNAERWSDARLLNSVDISSAATETSRWSACRLNQRCHRRYRQKLSADTVIAR